MTDTTKVPEMTALEKLTDGTRSHTVVVNGEPVTFTIRQIKTGQIPKLARAAGVLTHILMDQKAPMDMLKLVMFHTDDCLNILTVLTNKDRAVIDELEIDDTAAILAMCVEVNLDFFVQKVIPLLSGEMARLAGELQSKLQTRSGLKPSSS